MAPELDRRRTSLPFAPRGWDADLAYAIGLLATDGCLAGGKVIVFTSKDHALVADLLRCLGKTNKIAAVRTKTGGAAYRTQMGDVAFYRWLLTVGLTPRKSLTLGSIDVPDDFILAVTRGLLDGDGSIINKRYRADTRGHAGYTWEYLQTRFISASRPHIEWLRERLRLTLGIDGYLATENTRTGRHPITVLRFGKPASIRLLAALYADRNAPCLERKRAIWDAYVERNRAAVLGIIGPLAQVE